MKGLYWWEHERVALDCVSLLGLYNMAVNYLLKFDPSETADPNFIRHISLSYD